MQKDHDGKRGWLAHGEDMMSLSTQVVHWNNILVTRSLLHMKTCPETPSDLISRQGSGFESQHNTKRTSQQDIL